MIVYVTPLITLLMIKFNSKNYTFDKTILDKILISKQECIVTPNNKQRVMYFAGKLLEKLTMILPQLIHIETCLDYCFKLSKTLPEEK